MRPAGLSIATPGGRRQGADPPSKGKGSRPPYSWTGTAGGIAPSWEEGRDTGPLPRPVSVLSRFLRHGAKKRDRRQSFGDSFPQLSRHERHPGKAASQRRRPLCDHYIKPLSLGQTLSPLKIFLKKWLTNTLRMDILCFVRYALHSISH
jgi:hypothetical protein